MLLTKDVCVNEPQSRNSKEKELLFCPDLASVGFIGKLGDQLLDK